MTWMQAAGEDGSRARPGELKALLAGRFPHLFLILVLVVTALFLVRGIERESPTEDEWAHLVRGINYWQNRDMRVHVQHPPLANALAGIPSAFDDNPDLTQMKTWQEGYSPGLEYIRTDYERARGQLAKGRYMAMLFQLGLVVYVFYFCLSVFGWPTAAAAALLVAFNPTLLGQARYVATDMPAATMATIATGELARYLRQPARIATFALALAALVLSKHSGIIFVIFTTGIALLAAFLGKGHFSSVASVWRRLGRCLLHLALSGVIVLFAINAVYKFDRTGLTVRETLDTPEPKHWTTKRYKGQLLEERSPLPHLPEGLRIPIPYPYLVGVFGVREQDRMGYPAYFMGQSSRFGRWEYFPALLALKDPPGLLLLLGLGALLFVRRQRRGRSKTGHDSPIPATAARTGAQAEAPAQPSDEAAKPVEELGRPTEESAKPSEAKPVEEPTKSSEEPAKPVEEPEKPSEEPRKPTEASATQSEDSENRVLAERVVLREPVERAEDLRAVKSAVLDGPEPKTAVSRKSVSDRLLGFSLPSACFLLVSALFLAFIMKSNLNMGVRHALPVIPMVSVLAARAFAHAGELLSEHWLWMVRALGLSGIFSALISGPQYLNYYNFLAFGKGPFINVAGEDWGQDRQEFVRFAKEKGLSPLYYHTQTSTRKLEVDYLGLKYKNLGCKTRPKPGSWVAIHSQYVHRFESSNCALWMRDLTPEYKINDNIWIYKIPDRPKG